MERAKTAALDRALNRPIMIAGNDEWGNRPKTNKMMAGAMLAATALAAVPAQAHDGSPYVGIEAGGLIAKRLNFDAANGAVGYDNYLTIKHDVGYDVDLIVGFDAGQVRIEGELGIKRASHKRFAIRNTAQPGAPAVGFDGDGNTRTYSAMLSGWGCECCRMTPNPIHDSIILRQAQDIRHFG